MTDPLARWYKRWLQRNYPGYRWEIRESEAARKADTAVGPVAEVERLREVETAARALVTAHGPTPVPAWVRLRVDDLKAALDVTAPPSDD